jgi:hypothetical protein
VLMSSADREADRLARKPATVTQQGDGFWYQVVRRDTTDGTVEMQAVRVCEDCWQTIPRYVDFPEGLTSPESDGDAGGNFAKRRPMNVEGKEGFEALRKAVCLPCYLAAFQRCYPDAAQPEFSDLVIPPTIRYVPPPEPPMISIPEPRA